MSFDEELGFRSKFASTATKGGKGANHCPMIRKIGFNDERLR